MEYYYIFNNNVGSSKDAVFWGISPDGLASAIMVFATIAGSILTVYVSKNIDIRRRKKLTRNMVKSAFVNIHLDLEKAERGINKLMNEFENINNNSYSNPVISTTNTDLIISQSFEHLYLSFKPENRRDKFDSIYELWRDLIKYRDLAKEIKFFLDKSIATKNALGKTLNEYLESAFPKANSIHKMLEDYSKNIPNEIFQKTKDEFINEISRVVNAYNDLTDNASNASFINSVENFINPIFDLMRKYNLNEVKEYRELLQELNKTNHQYRLMVSFKEITAVSLKQILSDVNSLQNSINKFKVAYNI